MFATNAPNKLLNFTSGATNREKTSMTDFLFTVPSGEPVQLEPFHYCLVGQTQFSGKTTLIKRLSQWGVEQGFKVLIFDTKETEADYAGFGQEVPVCLRESTDSFVLIGLLESMFRRKLTPYYATLSRITEAAKGFDDIIERARELEQRTRNSWLKDACRVLYDLLERLKDETAKVETVTQLRLYPGVNRMVINDFSLEAQQLIVKNSFEDLLRIYRRRAIGVLDEGHKFTPQGYSSPATRPVMHVMTQGGKTELYGWIATQFLALTDKGPLKACAFKFLGTQDHITEVKHTMDLIPEIRGKFTSDDIMKLKLGHWILVRKRPPDVRVVYSLPLGVPSSIGRKVAGGELTPEHVRDHYLKVKKEDEDLVWKEKYEELKREFDTLAKDHELSEKRLMELEAERETLEKKIPKDIDDLKESYEKEIQRFKDDLKTADALKFQKDGEIAELRKELEDFRELKAVFTKLLLTPISTATPTKSPSEVTVHIEQPVITIVKERPPLTLKQADLEGRIAIVYAENLLPSDKTFSTKQLNTIMESRFGTKEFPGHFSKVLTKFVAWGYLEKVRTGTRWDYRVKMAPKEANEKGLLKEAETT